MTSRRFPANLKLEIRPSRLLCAYLLSSHSAVLVCLLFSPLPLLWTAVSALVLLVSAGYQLSSLFRQSGPYSVRGLAWREGRWFVRTAEGEGPAELSRCWVLPAAVGLQFKVTTRFKVLIVPDSCTADDFRRLRQILRFTRSVPGVKDGIQRLR
ncbi:MAG: hypothetical protein ACI9G5_000188 [Paracoccaceae bacterium]|jgi:hypothetical protein